MTITVNYVSGVPGLGKTRAAIDFMRRHIEGGLAGKDVGYLFYVAPTVDLLNQTIKNLKALLDPALHYVVELSCRHVQLSHLFLESHQLSVGDQ